MADDTHRREAAPIEPPVCLDLRRMASALAPMVDVWRRILLVHQPDEAWRCIACTRGGTGLPFIRWPCGPRALADLARRCHDTERPARPANRQQTTRWNRQHRRR